MPVSASVVAAHTALNVSAAMLLPVWPAATLQDWYYPPTAHPVWLLPALSPTVWSAKAANAIDAK